MVRELLIKFIKSEREDQGLSVEEVAEKVNVKPGTIAKIEDLKFKPPVDLLFEIMAILGCRIFVESKDKVEPIDDERYQLSVTESKGVWHCLDKKTNLSCKFTEGNFEGSQYFSVPDQTKNVILEEGINLANFIASNRREMTDWLLAYHKNLL